MAAAVAEAVARQPRGVVILHGTDTMHYTASALAFMLRNLSVPVVITGSMIPGGDSGSDALANLRDADRGGGGGGFRRSLRRVLRRCGADKGVIIRGCRARKMHSHAIDAFASINAPPIGTIAGEQLFGAASRFGRARRSTLTLATDLDTNVVLVEGDAQSGAGGA